MTDSFINIIYLKNNNMLAEKDCNALIEKRKEAQGRNNCLIVWIQIIK